MGFLPHIKLTKSKIKDITNTFSTFFRCAGDTAEASAAMPVYDIGETMFGRVDMCSKVSTTYTADGGNQERKRIVWEERA